MPDEYLEARTSEILEAAARRFARAGVKGATMEEVAEEAGLSVGTLYRYFEGKEDLVRALAEGGRSMNRSVREGVREAGGPREQLLALVRRYLGLLADPDGRETLTLSVRLWAEALASDVVGDELRRTYAAQLETLHGLIEDSLREASEPVDLDPDTGARAIISLLNDASLQVLIDPAMDLEAYERTVVDLVRGMLPADEQA